MFFNSNLQIYLLKWQVISKKHKPKVLQRATVIVQGSSGVKKLAKSMVLYNSYQLALKHTLLPHRISNKLFHSCPLKCSLKGLSCLMFCHVYLQTFVLAVRRT